MIYSIYQEINKTLVLDTYTGAIRWQEKKSHPQLEIKHLQNLLAKKNDGFLTSSSEDINILIIEPYSSIVLREVGGIEYLYKSNNNLGELKYKFTSSYTRDKELDMLKRFGGLIITFVEKDIKDINKKVIFIMSNVRVYEKKSTFPINNIVKEEENFQYINSNSNITIQNSGVHNSEEYIETNIKLPKGLFHHIENQELLNAINKNNHLINDMYREFNNKLLFINKSLNRNDENEKNIQIIDKQKETIKELNDDIEKLIHDREILDNERIKAVLIAKNQLKKDLRLSKISLQKHIDLDEIIPLKESIFSIFDDVLTELNIDEETIKRIHKNENLNNKVEILSDNFDSKVQSLLDIREDFIKYNIIESKGE
ncbi:hypothetical protein [Peribacillus sp. S4]|uniref:hypothetical protein n=1 Tax=Peribacillus sp. S4 TaxID=3384451 RepID=UPI00398A0F4D